MQAEHFEDYKFAEEDARMVEVGVWNDSSKDKNAFLYLNKEITEKDIIKSYSGETLRGVVEEIHPSKALIFLSKEGIIITVNFSEVQAVVLSEKLESKTIDIQMDRAKVTFVQ